MISIVIPVYNEAKALPGTLGMLSRQTGAFEVIVVDGGSTDATRQIAMNSSPVRMVHAPKGRASQMNAGARAAVGDWLLFLHADTVLPDGALAVIADLQSVEAGGFRHRFSGKHWLLRFVSAVDNLRCRCTRIFYGDQAMFVRRELFWRLGGFPQAPVLEDVLFCERLKKCTRPVLLDRYAITDSRKFEQHGIVRSTFRVLRILFCHACRLPVRERAFFEDVR